MIKFDADVDFTVDARPVGFWSDPPATARFISMPLLFDESGLRFDARIWIEGLRISTGSSYTAPVSFLDARSVRENVLAGASFTLDQNGHVGGGTLLGFRS